MPEAPGGPCTSLPSPLSPCWSSPSLMGEKRNAATVGVSQARTTTTHLTLETSRCNSQLQPLTPAQALQHMAPTVGSAEMPSQLLLPPASEEPASSNTSTLRSATDKANVGLPLGLHKFSSSSLLLEDEICCSWSVNLSPLQLASLTATFCLQDFLVQNELTNVSSCCHTQGTQLCSKKRLIQERFELRWLCEMVGLCN